MLGHLPPYLLGSSFRLDVEAARNAIFRRVAEPLGLEFEAATRGILTIVDNNMVGALRVVSVARGHDPRDFSLLPFGGAGPLHGGTLARLLGMSTIVVPPGPGVLSALGLLVSNLKAEFTRTCLQEGRRIQCRCGRTRVCRPRGRSRRVARCEGRARRGVEGHLVRQPALSGPGLRTQRAVVVPGRHRSIGGGNRDGLPSAAREARSCTCTLRLSTPDPLTDLHRNKKI